MISPGKSCGGAPPMLWGQSVHWVGKRHCSGRLAACEFAARSLRVRCDFAKMVPLYQSDGWEWNSHSGWHLYIYIAHKYLQYRQFLGISNKPSSILMPKNSPARVLVYSHSFNIPRSLRVLSESQNACRVDTNWCRSGRDRDMQIFCCANEARFMAVSATCGKELLQRHSKGNWRELNSW